MPASARYKSIFIYLLCPTGIHYNPSPIRPLKYLLKVILCSTVLLYKYVVYLRHKFSISIMVRYRGTIYVCHEPDKVWKLLSDWGRLPQWDSNAVQMTPRSSENGQFALGIGALWDCRFDCDGRRVDARYRCVEWDRVGLRAVFEATSTFIRTRDTLEIIQAPGGCQVSMQFELYYRNILAPLSFTLDTKMQRACPRIMNDLQKYVEEQLEEEAERASEMVRKQLTINNFSNVTL